MQYQQNVARNFVEFFCKNSALFENTGISKRALSLLPAKSRENRGSNPTSYPKTAFGIYGNLNKKSGSKNPEMVDATGIFPVASIPFGFCGAPAGIRTPDTLLKRQVLCLLSYWGVLFGGSLGWDGGTRTHYIGVKVRCVTITLHPSIDFAEKDRRCRPFLHMGWDMGLEPTTPGTTIRCSTN